MCIGVSVCVYYVYIYMCMYVYLSTFHNYMDVVKYIKDEWICGFYGPLDVGGKYEKREKGSQVEKYKKIVLYYKPLAYIQLYICVCVCVCIYIHVYTLCKIIHGYLKVGLIEKAVCEQVKILLLTGWNY